MACKKCEGWRNEAAAMVRYAIEYLTNEPELTEGAIKNFEALCGVSVSPELRAALREEDTYVDEAERGDAQEAEV